MTGLLVGDVFTNAARAAPDKVAAALAGQTLTFADLEHRANRIATGLHRHGVSTGTPIAVWTDLTLDVVPLYAAAAKLGGIYAPFPGNWTYDDAFAAATVLNPGLVIADASHQVDAAQLTTTLGCPLTDVAELDVTPTPVPTRFTESAPHVVFFTSGSSGRPKGVVLSHRTQYLRTHPGALPEPRGPMVCTYPLSHMGGWTISLQQWQARDTVVYLDRPDGSTIVRAVRQSAATRLNCIPAVWRRVLDELDPAGTLPTLRFADSGTSQTPPDLLAAIRRCCPNATVRVFYGSTEAGNVTTTFVDGATPAGSCGQPSYATQIRIAADAELQVRGPLLFDGYYGDPDATATAFDDGWYRTGDLAQIDASGRVSIVGRAGDLIRTGGETVVPAEVEAALADLEDIREVAVVGRPDPTWGEVVCAVVVPKDPTHPPRLADIVAACAGKLAKYKLPRELHVVDALPRTPATGQVQRAQLVRQLGG